MLKGFINLPWWLRRRSEPKVYDVCCPQCGWRKTIELGKVREDSRCIHGAYICKAVAEADPIMAASHAHALQEFIEHIHTYIKEATVTPKEYK